MKHYQSLMSNSGSSIEVLLNKLKNIASNHFNQPSVDSYKTGIVQDYIKLLGNL